MKIKNLISYLPLPSFLMVLLTACCTQHPPASQLPSSQVTLACCSVNLTILQNGQSVTNECEAFVKYAGNNVTETVTNFTGMISVPIHAAPSTSGVYVTGRDNNAIAFYWTTQMTDIATSTNFVINIEQCQH
jgi:hypothetical protein